MKQPGIKQIRQSLNLRAEDVAKAVGITTNYVFMIESGIRTPNDIIKQKLCKLYGIDMNTLFLALNITKCDK